MSHHSLIVSFSHVKLHPTPTPLNVAKGVMLRYEQTKEFTNIILNKDAYQFDKLYQHGSYERETCIKNFLMLTTTMMTDNEV